MGEGDAQGDAAVQRPWRKALDLSSALDGIESFLGSREFDRAPWLVVALIGGIALWFRLAGPWQWIASIGVALIAALAATALWRDRPERTNVRMATVGFGLAIALGVLLIWSRSAIVGAEPIERPVLTSIDGRVLDRRDKPAQGRVRITLAYRDAVSGSARKVRINVPLDHADPAIDDGARIRLRARLMPPAPPMLPGAYDFARTAWFGGLAATGSLVGPITVVEAAPRDDWGLDRVQRALSAHVRGELGGSAGAIAAAFASGDRGAISEADEDAMRDAGLTHLLSISGLHVSAVIAAAYILAIRLLALWPWFALRVRLPLVAASIAAVAGIGYTLLTGAEVPTVRSCAAAMLVLGALALGREALSLRMVAVAAAFVIALWPESVIGPSFQMSFSAVIAIVALHQSAPVKRFLGPQEETWRAKFAKRALMLLVTGFVIELALMPIVLLHFHRAGIYGAFANVVAIPLVTFVSMPLIAIALTLDIVGLGAPAWWLAGQSLDLLLTIAHFTAAQPGSVKMMPQMSHLTFALFAVGGLWLALWHGRVRLLGLIPSALATVMLLHTPVPDILVSGGGQHVGITGEDERLLVLRDTRSEFTRDNLLELAGMDGDPLPLAQWPGARCNPDFCVLTIERAGRSWHLLMARGRSMIEERALAAACARADIVVASRWLPRSCRPLWLKADGRLLARTGGLAITLADEQVHTVAQDQGNHGWWRDRGR